MGGSGRHPGHNLLREFDAPSFSALNSFLDSLRASDDYAAFADEVAPIRTLGVVSQTRKVMMWEP